MSAAPHPVIGLVGLGAMGLGIAQVYLQAGYAVIATDRIDSVRDQATTRLHEQLEARVKSGKLSSDAQHAMLSRLKIVEDLSGFATADLVIEAIIEALAPKKALFEALEAVLRPDAILATNTSSLSVTALAQGLSHPERIIGLHFFNPAPVMKLVELVATPQTNAPSLQKARHWTEACGKTVITCKDRPGFIVNRCARPFYGEALALLEEGRTASDIDASLLAAGYRIGPLSLIDLVGADINLAATQSLAQAMDNHPRYAIFDRLKSHVAAGLLGRKSGKGFLFPDKPQAPPADAKDICERIQAVLVNEACTLLEEGGIDENGIDTALKLGLNFPYGPFEAARRIGMDKIRHILQVCAAQAKPHLQGRYTISPLLQTLH
jgi:3-hydroxybutyryl-CoA dehydrogenase